MATISVDIRRQIDTIDQNIYGGFIEHLGRCIYGGIYEPGSPLSDERGYRRDVVEAIQRLKVPNIRWPGGNFVSGYHWMDGIGPKDKRPKRMELAWHTVESNEFGTDEFVEYCRAVGTEPHICVNMGSGTMDEARDWVEYCNGSENTYHANLRRSNGHQKPYNIKYWGLGNEVSGGWQIGHKEAEDYARAALEFSKVMKWTDPNIKLIACGSCQQTPAEMEWNRIVVDKLINVADYLSIHMYVNNRENNYYDYMGTSEHIEKYIRAVRGILDGAVYRYRDGHKMKISFDEWNATFSFGRDHPLHERYTLEDALVVAMFLNSFIRHADVVKMANIAQLVNIIPPIHTSPEDMFLQTIFYPLELFSCGNGAISLDAYCESERFETQRYGMVPYLDVSASYDPEKRRISVNVIDIARFAPTGSNRQPVKWLVIYNSDEVHELAGQVIDWMKHLAEENPSAGYWDRLVAAWEAGVDYICRGALHLIIAHAPKGSSTTDCAIALTYLELAAPAFGLGTCWGGFLNAAANAWPSVQKTLALPEGNTSYGVMIVGYPKYKYHRLPLRNEAEIIWH